MRIWDRFSRLITILGTASAIKFDPRESYLQYYFPQQALTTNPRSFRTELKNAHILPNFKHNASQRSRKQNGRTPSLQTDFHPRSVQKVTNDLRQLPQYDPYQTHFAHPLNSRKMNRRLRTDPRHTSEGPPNPDTFMAELTLPALPFHLCPWSFSGEGRSTDKNGKGFQDLHPSQPSVPCPTFDPGGRFIHQLLLTNSAGERDKRLRFKSRSEEVPGA